MNNRPAPNRARKPNPKPFGKKTGVSSNNQPFGAKIMTLKDLHKEEFEASPSKPIKSNKKPSNLLAERPSRLAPKLKVPTGGGRAHPVRIGKSLDPGKWKCNMCKFVNEKDATECSRCESAKGEIKRKGFE